MPVAEAVCVPASAREVESPAPARSTQSAITRCTHCALPVPPGVVVGSREAPFCCTGCKAAYEIIHACGLGRYYDLASAADAEAGGRVASAQTTWAQFDDPVFRRLNVSPAPGGASSAELYLSGVHCSACVWLLERLPRIVPGVIEARLDFRRAMLSVTWVDAEVRLSRIAGVLASVGYTPHPARDARAREQRRADDRRQLVHLAVAGCCAGNVMLFAFALYAGLFDAMSPSHAALFRWASMLLTLVALAWPGATFFRTAALAIRTRTPHIDVPIALALGVGGAWSVLGTLRGSGEVYFDTVSVLVFALLVGRFLQARQQRSAADAVEMLFSVVPGTAHVVRDGRELDVPVEALGEGDLVRVRAGESFCADGVIESGASLADLSVLTGESRPVPVGPNDTVHAGAVNLAAAVLVRVTATGEQTRVGALMRMVSDAARRRAPIVRFADRAGRWFTVGMSSMSLATLVAWWAFAGVGAGFEHAVALLMVTCPCALGLATPLTMSIALGRAARAGMLIKGGDALQKLARPGIMFIDKTGTLTTGRLEVASWSGPSWVRPLVQELERQSSHPIARAIVGDSAALGLHVHDVEQVVGGGIRGVVQGRSLAVGSPDYIASLVGGDGAAAGVWDEGKRLGGMGFTPVAVSIDGRVMSWIALGDRVRAEAPAAISALRSEGWDIRILSGDHPALVRAVGRKVGLTESVCRGGQTPEDKVHAVQAELGTGRCVVMVGDGVNDAAALAQADVGIAVRGGAEASLAAADAYLLHEGLASLTDLTSGARRTMRVIRRNLGVSIAYNACAGSLAMLGLVGPLLAALVVPVSSLTALGVSVRSRTFEPRTPTPLGERP